MLTINVNENESFAAHFSQDYYQRVDQYFSETQPLRMQLFNSQSDKIKYFKFAKTKANEMGFVNENDIVRLIEIMLFLGCDFDHDPQYVAAQKIITTPGYLINNAFDNTANETDTLMYALFGFYLEEEPEYSLRVQQLWQFFDKLIIARSNRMQLFESIMAIVVNRLENNNKQQLLSRHHELLEFFKAQDITKKSFVLCFIGLFGINFIHDQRFKWAADQHSKQEQQTPQNQSKRLNIIITETEKIGRLLKQGETNG